VPGTAITPVLTTVFPTPTPSRPRTTTSKKPPASTRSLVVVLDPGHNGGNGSHPGEIGEEVPAGHGQTKACNTAGTTSNDGYPEHAFTFDVALRVQRILAAHHVVGLLTRSNDHGIGPCVNERATFGNAHVAAAVVAIHADGHVGGHGFHVIEAAAAPAGAGVAASSHRLAVSVHDRFLAESGFGTATYIGAGGYAKRTDLAGLNLSTRPTVFIECGNMRDSADAARMETPVGRQRIAVAIADGILRYLGV
jgi:N-acetylmuramoyl-L-alanine amidase